MNRANDKILDIIMLTDGQYLRETENLPRSLHRKRRFSAKIITAAAAAVMTVTAGAAAAATLIHKESVEFYYNEEMTSEIEKRGYMVGQVTENEHVRLTLENLMVDENYAFGVVTAEFLDAAGIEAFRHVNAILLDNSGLNVYHLGAGSEIIEAILGHSVNGINNTNDGRQAYTLQIYLHTPFSEKKAKLPKDLSIVFVESSLLPNGFDEIVTAKDIPESVLEGLRFEISTEPNVKSVSLSAESGHKGIISQFTYTFQFDRINMPALGKWGFPNEMTLNYNDGSQLILYSRKYKTESDFSPIGGILGAKTDNGVHGEFRNILDLDGLVSVEFAGETYKVI